MRYLCHVTSTSNAKQENFIGILQAYDARHSTKQSAGIICLHEEGPMVPKCYEVVVVCTQ